MNLPTLAADAPLSPSSIQDRKAEHLRICLDDKVQCQEVTTGLEYYQFSHCALPELDFEEIDLSTSFLGQVLGAPLLISSMTGGTKTAQLINQRLAAIAQHYGIAMGVGSQRVAVENPAVTDTFAVRSIAPSIPLFANLGAVQLNYNYGLPECQRAIDDLAANALILHLNPLQECIQSRGDTNFRHLLPKIEALCAGLPVPVIVKEVGNGISAATAQKLIDVGVAAIDVAGAGGTSWAKVESERAEDQRQRRLGQTFAEWGIPTAECIVDVRSQLPDLALIASGGLRNGLDAAKALALGADLVGMAYPFLKAAHESETALSDLMAILLAELQMVLFCTGHRNLADFRAAQPLLRRQPH
ncbi:type 2 isopentenyl-diphosphate Delta-isomerase [Synechococcales cyanobacterium C]|uniref:Isopentenyl-diphosphate delta-isomerase n=1 Tax=Petrachloros mirabilis ULC683 TaxID=2781853 RepID=A0A8K2A7D1_9CYAN|nr:type 2 isopentenyl-diphosphate Delta-isomerase [Petrachloros mirabilis ULC683]